MILNKGEGNMNEDTQKGKFLTFSLGNEALVLKYYTL